MTPPNPLVLPPSLAGGVAPEGLREGFARARWLLGAYWLLTGTGFALLLLVAALYWHGSSSFASLVALAVSSLLGVALGNVLGLLRVRAGWVGLTVVGLTLLTCVGAIGMGAVVVFYVLMFLWSVGCGHLTVQRRFSLGTLWVPVICWTAVMLTILDRAGRMHAWQGGQKEGVWEPATLTLLLLLVLMFFVFLAAQEHYHTLAWQAAGAGGAATLERHRVKGAMRFTKRGMAAIVVLTLLVGGSVATVSPYLWRTAPAPRRENREQTPSPPPGPPRQSPDWDGEALRRALRRIAREAEEQGKNALPFVPLFLLNRPLRRWWLLRRLRRRRGAASERAQNLWRYVTIALDDGGLGPRPGERLDELVTRVNTTRAAQNLGRAEDLAETVAVYDRVRFGLGIPHGAMDVLHESAARAFVSLRQPLGTWARVWAWFRSIP
jgi:hypothetical protein